MIRPAIALLALLILTACAQPVPEGAYLVAEPVMEAPAMAAPADAAKACQPGDDGIGGTGCKAE